MTEVKKYHWNDLVVKESFISLESALRNAIKEKFTDKCWVTDFSNKEVIFNKDIGVGAGLLYKIGYKVVGDTIEFDGEPTEVDRKITYESFSINADQLIEIVRHDAMFRTRKEIT